MDSIRAVSDIGAKPIEGKSPIKEGGSTLPAMASDLLASEKERLKSVFSRSQHSNLKSVTEERAKRRRSVSDKGAAAAAAAAADYGERRFTEVIKGDGSRKRKAAVGGGEEKSTIEPDIGSILGLFQDEDAADELSDSSDSGRSLSSGKEFPAEFTELFATEGCLDADHEEGVSEAACAEASAAEGDNQPFMSPTAHRRRHSATFGPSPLRRTTSIKTTAPTTAQREEERIQIRLQRGSLKPNSIEHQVQEKAEAIYTEMKRVFQARMEKVPEALIKKCYSICNITVYQRERDGTLIEQRSRTLAKTFWSSKKTASLTDGSPIVGIVEQWIRSATRSGRSFALMDHHAERALLMQVFFKMRSILSDLGVIDSLTERHVIVINILTKLSSCPHCARTFGLESRMTRIADGMAQRIKDIAFTQPYVVVLHQGVSPYHKQSRTKKEPVVREYYPSSSVLNVDYERTRVSSKLDFTKV